MAAVRIIPLWLTIVAVAGAAGLVVFLSFSLRQESPKNTQDGGAWTSSLLPDGWLTYMGDVWTMGYPADWSVQHLTEESDGKVTSGSVFFQPVAGVGSDYVTIGQERVSLSDITLRYQDVQPTPTRDAFLFAGYPAVKYTFTDRVEYYISYNKALIRILTTHPDNAEVDIMLATFEFTN